MKPLVLFLMIAATPALAVDVPSNQPVDLQEVLVDNLGDEVWLRFRFVAPLVARDNSTLDPEALGADMDYLCSAVALPYIADHALTGQVIVISLADRATAFGVADPEATQVFEAYRPADGICIWEGL